MSYDSRAIGRLRFTLGLTGWFLVMFLVTALGLYLGTAHVIQRALDEDWETREFEMACTERVRAVPTPEIRRAVQAEFDENLPLLMLPIIVVGVLGGLLLTVRATQGPRRIARTVREILDQGEIHRRLDTSRYHGPWRDLARLFNHSLEKNAALITGLHESLDHVAHDLKTPMTRLRATAEAALAAPGKEGMCESAISDCLEESENVLTMLDALMDLAEAETGAMRLDREDVDLAELTESVRDLFEFVAEEKSVRIDTDIPAGLTANGDSSRLRRVLANLVDNAIKYGPVGGTVRIAGRAEPGAVVLEVADEGPGIPEADLARIWDRLYRGDRSRHERGLGLGLSFVKAMVEAHGGAVAVATRDAEGSTFTIRLPA